MGSQGPEDAYVTLLLTDTYLAGALVLAHSLRDAGTTKKLACLVTLDTVAGEVVTQLKTVYDYVIPVPTIRNAHPANLALMNRPDLHSAFTKVNLWNQLQFRKIVYIDADVVACRAPDELFDLEAPFSAAPDIGWPDLFNTGVMALTPNKEDYNAMMSMAEQGTSFDGADQGLLNMHFKDNFNRLSFTYNVTPSAHYQYVPAYLHFQSSINLVHFIGPDKPWRQGRTVSTGSGPFNNMVNQWWAVYDRHYGKNVTQADGSYGAPEIVRYFVKGEFGPKAYGSSGWDAQRQSPPAGSRPEAFNLPRAHYEMSSDTTQYGGYASSEQMPPPIFPWEQNRPQPTRVFNDTFPPQEEQLVVTFGESGGSDALGQSDAATETASFTTESVSELHTSEPNTPTAFPTYPPVTVASDPWATFTLANAWDDVPEIDRYVGMLQKHRRGKSGGSLAGVRMGGAGGLNKDAREVPGRRINRADLVEAVGPDRRSAVVYVCGVPAMTDEFVRELTAPTDGGGVGMEPHRVFFEKWW
ncbi:glycogenin [Magnaporthiopsis poae ATCC 64411]|uniref:glycogenin glucosyltransferase n=1 Tax=Magnaporthiopsis poae (strain ATCC 64411 / 73-15) TaxID=644358 RepID=A0A0C4E5J1_MAGP6|nr:glycogenin [Magnaporthiopsis poae ATCC 64411]